MVICLERGADLHMSQLMPLPLTSSCSSKIQIGFTFLVLAHPGSTEQRPVKRVCLCVCVCVCVSDSIARYSVSSDMWAVKNLKVKCAIHLRSVGRVLISLS